MKKIKCDVLRRCYFALIFRCGTYHGTNFSTLFFKWSLAVFHSWDCFEHSKFTPPYSNTAFPRLPSHLPRFRALSFQAQESALNIHKLVISELQALLLFFSQGYHFPLAKFGVLNQSHFWIIQAPKKKKEKYLKNKVDSCEVFFPHSSPSNSWMDFIRLSKNIPLYAKGRVS